MVLPQSSQPLAITATEGDRVINPQTPSTITPQVKQLIESLCDRPNIEAADLIRFDTELERYRVLSSCGERIASRPAQELPVECTHQGSALVICPIVSSFLGRIEVKYTDTFDLKEVEAIRDQISSLLLDVGNQPSRDAESIDGLRLLQVAQT